MPVPPEEFADSLLPNLREVNQFNNDNFGFQKEYDSYVINLKSKEQEDRELND